MLSFHVWKLGTQFFFFFHFSFVLGELSLSFLTTNFSHRHLAFSLRRASASWAYRPWSIGPSWRLELKKKFLCWKMFVSRSKNFLEDDLVDVWCFSFGLVWFENHRGYTNWRQLGTGMFVAFFDMTCGVFVFGRVNDDEWFYWNLNWKSSSPQSLIQTCSYVFHIFLNIIDNSNHPNGFDVINCNAAIYALSLMVVLLLGVAVGAGATKSWVFGSRR